LLRPYIYSWKTINRANPTGKKRKEKESFLHKEPDECISPELRTFYGTNLQRKVALHVFALCGMNKELLNWTEFVR